MLKDIIQNNLKIKSNDKEMKVLKENFPSCFDVEGNFDIEKFQNIIKDKVDITKEGYELNFLGKSYAKLLASLDTTTVIKPDLEHNNKPENKNSENIYISGDNIDALKHLLKSYAGSIKCIYIDPPYNTGDDGFVYNDSFSFTAEELVSKLSISEDEANRIVDMTSKGASSHSAWLTFMYPRLLLARDLLKDDGVIFISIDDHEQSNLKLICDDVFGEENFEGHIHWRRRSNQPNDKTKLIGLVAEHILVYSRDRLKLKESGVGKIALTGDFSNPDNDPKGAWASKPWKSGSDQSGTRYTITTPTGVVLNEEWMGDETTYKKLVDDNRILFPRGGDGFPRKKYYKFEREAEGQCACNWWNHKVYGDNQEASRELENIFGFKNAFSNPKPVKLIENIINLGNIKDNDIVLDFFGGSGTTAQAVLKTSLMFNCKFMIVQLPENIDCLLDKASLSEKEKWKNIVKMLDNNKRPHSLDYIGIERIIRAAKKIKEEYPDTTADLGFKHFTLQECDDKTLDKLESFSEVNLVTDNNILNEFGKDTVLTTWLNADGYGLTSKTEEINLAGYKAYYIGKHLYLLNAGFGKDSEKALFEKYNNEPHFNPENIVLFGYSFSKWTILNELKINLKQLPNKNINFDIRY